MTSAGVSPTRAQLEAAIAAQEELRPTLGDATADATIRALRAQLDQLAEVPHQRKLVTVLFMDVAGSTSLMRGRDPEETMAIMDSALARLAVPVHDHGGRVTRFMGDGFMAVFGLPTARENDPEMAVRSGLRIVDAADVLAEDLEAEHGIEGFGVRVGVNTGLVVTGGVTEAEDTIMGDAVNLAARLEAAAATGGVLISRDTYQHVRGLFDVEDGGTIDAKGFPEPVAVYRVLGRAVGDTRRSARGIEGLEIPMVGRQRELEQLRDAVAALTTGDAGLRAITIVGDAGLGKSRLVAEFSASVVTADHVLLKAQGMLEAEALPYALVKDLVERRYVIRNDDTADFAREKLVAGVAADLGDAGAGSEQKAHFVGQLIGYDFTDDPDVRATLDAPQQIRSRAVMYLGDTIGAIARRQPTIVLIEDLHWADQGSFDVLEALFEELADVPLLVVAAARPSLRTRRPDWGLAEHHELLRLEPLTEAESDELVSAVLHKVIDCPDDLRHRLVEHAGGIPYYLEETVRMLVDDGVIVPGADVWTVDRDRLPELRIPPTLTGVIQARLDGLPAPQRVAVQQASVVGRVFWDAIVEHLVSQNADDIDVTAVLHDLGTREMVHERATSTFSDAAEYTFHHEVLRSVAYEGVLLRIRRAYHSLVADWLIANRGDRVAELTGLIAGHLERAGRDAEALENFSEAAEAALAAYAVETADGFYERALRLTPDDESTRRFTLLLGRERTLGMRGSRADQEAALGELAELAGDDPSLSATAGVRYSLFHFFGGDYPRAEQAARDAVEAALGADSPTLEGQARSVLAWALLMVDDLAAARSEAELGLARAMEGDDEKAAMRVHNTLGMVLRAGSDYSSARQHITVYLEAAQRRADLESELTAANNLGVVETQLGEYEAARAHFARNLQIAAEVGDRLSVGSALVNLAWVTASQGDWSAAREYATQGIARKRDTGHAEAIAEGLMWLGHAEFGLGDLDAARAAYEEALQLREALGQRALAMGARAGLARTALAAADLDTALSHAAVVTGYLDDGGSVASTWEPLRIHLTCAEVLRAAGDPDAARVLARAHRLLLADAERIADAADRATFLREVPWNREIIELAGEGAR